MTKHSQEHAPKPFGVSRWLAHKGDSLIEGKQPLSGYALEAASFISFLVEGAGHVVGMTGRAIARSGGGKQAH